MHKGDKEHIKYEEEICISLNEYKLDDQALKLILKKKKEEKREIFPTQAKSKAKAAPPTTTPWQLPQLSSWSLLSICVLHRLKMALRPGMRNLVTNLTLNSLHFWVRTKPMKNLMYNLGKLGPTGQRDSFPNFSLASWAVLGLSRAISAHSECLSDYALTSY